MPKSRENPKYRACKGKRGKIRYTRISGTNQMKICIDRGSGKSVGSGIVEPRKKGKGVKKRKRKKKN